jgi:hypothetical protein
LKSFFIPAASLPISGVHLAVSAFQVRVGNERRATVSWSDDVDHAQVVFLDDPVQVHVQEVETWRGSPVAEKTRLDVCPRERLLEEGLSYR